MMLVPRISRVLSGRLLSTHASVERLNQRSLLRVSGSEATAFLQGLVTNDLRHLEEGATSMFCMFLNTKGRVLFDSIIYQAPEADVFLLECDVEALPALQKHLKMYRVRRKIDITSVENETHVWAMYPTHGELAMPVSKSPDVLVCRDPRLKELGFRVLAPSGVDVSERLGGTPNSSYRSLRYKLGVGEGVLDHPIGNCFPLEANCDYLHGVSFHKGCYIGQELTARTHHTGVIRKRLMPLSFQNLEGSSYPEADTPVTRGEGRSLGKLRGVDVSSFGLALLRVIEVLQSSEPLTVGSATATTLRPSWWPTELSKERPSS